jgi:hypothetical protein
MNAAAWIAGALLLAAADGSWKADVATNGLRRAEVAGEARLGALRTPAKLALQCRPGAKGSLVWSLQIEHANKFGTFHFDDFEGPDAIALDQELSELAIEGGLMHPQVKAKQSGFFHGDRADSFAFEVAADAGAASEAALLADAIGPGTLGIAWTVTSARDVQARIEAHFPAVDAADAVRSTMSGCGPAPEISSEMASAWQGKDPIAAGIFDQRAVDWRLQALLGADYAAFREAFAKAEPVGTSGSMLYLLGHGEDGSTAAWYADRKGGIGEAVLIRAHKTQRYFDEDAPRLIAPGAVREFIAKAM